MDSYLDLAQKFAFGFVVHLVNKHQSQLINPTSQIPATIVVVFAVIIVSWLTEWVKGIKHKKAIVLKYALNLFFMFVTSILAYLLIAVIDGFFEDDLGADLTLLSLYRPIILIVIIITCLVLVRLASGKFSEEFEAEEKDK